MERNCLEVTVLSASLQYRANKTIGEFCPRKATGALLKLADRFFSGRSFFQSLLHVLNFTLRFPTA